MADLRERYLRGEVLDDVAIIDCHTHLGPWYNFHIPGDPWAEGMISVMNRIGVDRVVCAPHLAIGPDFREGNRIIAGVCTRHPDRFSAYCGISPHYPGAEVRAELERCFGEPHFVGIKIHPSTHQYPADGPGYDPMWAFANERRLPVLSHTWENNSLCSPKQFGPILERYPDVPMLLGHCGGGPAGFDASIEVAKQFPRAYLDLTCSMVYRGLVERMVEEVGADQVLFGSDAPFIDMRPRIGHLVASNLPGEVKRKILGENARRVFGL